MYTVIPQETCNAYGRHRAEPQRLVLKTMPVIFDCTTEPSKMTGSFEAER